MGNSPDILNTMKDTFFNVLPFSIILSVILFAAGTILLLFLISKYNNSAYYKRTRLPFFSLFRFSIFGDEDDSESLGYYGEYQIYKKLRYLENCGAEFLFNLYLTKPDGGTSEVDVVMICEKSIFVFESKNYSGWIFGDESKPMWYQTLSVGNGKSQKNSFYNPIAQNRNHIKYLKQYIRDDIPVYSVIVFSQRCTLKKITLNTADTYVRKRNDLPILISDICRSSKGSSLGKDEIANLYNKLSKYMNASSEVKEKHVNSIKHRQAAHKAGYSKEAHNPAAAQVDKFHTQEELQYTADGDDVHNDVQIQRSEQIQNSAPHASTKHICPRCGGMLVMRTAARGAHAGETFYGCSNYPKCRFMENVSHEQLQKTPSQ